MHPRLASIEAKVTAEMVHMTDEQRRENARQAILEPFAERPMQLIEGAVIEGGITPLSQLRIPRNLASRADISIITPPATHSGG